VSALESPLIARSPLASAPEAAAGWRAPNDRLALTVRNDLSVALITVARGRFEAFEREAIRHLGAPLPAERSASFSGPVTVVAAGRGCYLLVKQGEFDDAVSSLIVGGSSEPRSAVDYSDQLVFFALEGPDGPRVLSALCSVDFDQKAFPESAAIVARLHDARAYIWREAGARRYMIGVQRSLALHVWEALLEACRAHSSTP
jgi:heterotetrameric sarcosine oxidase gamma subunit